MEVSHKKHRPHIKVGKDAEEEVLINFLTQTLKYIIIVKDGSVINLHIRLKV